MNWILRRKAIIEKIRNSIIAVEKAGKEVDYSKLADEVCAEVSCSKRTALEYIRTAKIQKIRYFK